MPGICAYSLVVTHCNFTNYMVDDHITYPFFIFLSPPSDNLSLPHLPSSSLPLSPLPLPLSSLLYPCLSNIVSIPPSPFLFLSSPHTMLPPPTLSLFPFRLIILSTSGHSKSHRYHGRGASIDLSMWIALNNIMNVEMTNNSVVRSDISSRGSFIHSVSRWDLRQCPD